tara:strand:- start:5105 stop:5239 length:135 start_codon:yes stop_codon:yes gene_type:complete
MRMIREKKVAPHGMRKYQIALENGSWEAGIANDNPPMCTEFEEV